MIHQTHWLRNGEPQSEGNMMMRLEEDGLEHEAAAHLLKNSEMKALWIIGRTTFNNQAVDQEQDN